MGDGKGVQLEYLFFDAAVFLPCLVLSLWSRQATKRALFACAVVAIPFVAWDAAVVGRFWWFNPRFVSGVSCLGLPIEEVLFFIAVPFASLFSWQVLFAHRATTRRPWLTWPFWATGPVGIWLLVSGGPAYTGSALLSLGVATALDHWLGTKLLRQARFRAFLGFVAITTLVCNGYLTARPVVLYGEAYQLGWRIFTIPIEDFVYGFALVIANVSLFEWCGALPLHLASLIERRFAGYRHTVVAPNLDQPQRLTARPVRVAVIGSGIAGLTAATVLSERGFEVVLKEKNEHLGGKVGAWREGGPDGSATVIEHGFHAFFRQYYNLNRLLARVGVTAHFRAIDDYVIVDREGERLSFGALAKTPGLNLLSLASAGIVPWRDLLTNPKLRSLDPLLRYQARWIFEQFDRTSFATFADQAALPPRLRLAFNTFARAFFAEEQRISMAELIKGFHFYFLSNDAGLLYDYLSADYDTCLLQPFRERLVSHGARIETSRAVRSLERGADASILVDGEPFAHVVLAADVAATKEILLASPVVAREAPTLSLQAQTLAASQRYAVLRVWLDRQTGADLPIFVITEREQVLDAVTFNHRFQPEANAWATKTGGGVYELHCYAVPEALPDDETIREALMTELGRRFPALTSAKVIHSHLQVKRDFTAFHVGMAATRPSVRTEIAQLVLAGDWVKLDHPAMLMEAACMSGLLAANAILSAHGVREELVEAVPSQGLLPAPAAR